MMNSSWDRWVEVKDTLADAMCMQLQLKELENPHKQLK